MSFGSYSTGKPVVPKFDMHTYTSSMTDDEVANMASKYDIPLDLRPRAPDPTLTMNKLPLNAIAFANMSEFLKFPMVNRVRIGLGTALLPNEVIVQHTTLPLLVKTPLPAKLDSQRAVERGDERIIAAKEKKKLKESQDMAVGKRARPEGPSQRAKRKKNTPLSLALSDDTDTDSPPRAVFDTIHSVTPITTVAPIVDDAEARGSNQGLQSDGNAAENVGNVSQHDDNANVVNSPAPNFSPPSEHSSHSERRAFVSTSGGFGRHTFPSRNSNGDEGASLRNHLSPPVPFVPSWGLTTDSILNDLGRGALAQADLLQRYEALNDDFKEWYQVHSSCGNISQSLVDTQKELVEVCQARATVITDLEKEALDAKTSSLSKAKVANGQLNAEYKKRLAELFNQEITIGWSDGVKFDKTEEDVKAILETATDYDPQCHSTFIATYDALFTKSYPYIKRIVESFRLPLGDLQNMWPEGEGPTVGGGTIESRTDED
ncbi:hypothetical protein Tco_0546731 [Tanacetum coccineum]